MQTLENKIIKNDKSDLKKYIEKIHKNDDGWITVTTKKDKVWKQYHYKVEELESAVTSLIEENTNVYMSINSFYIPQRKIVNIRKINAIYVEFDWHNEDSFPIEEDFEALFFFLEEKYDVVPEPSLVVNSGRGLHLYWVIEDVPKQGKKFWTEIRDEIVEELKTVECRNFKLDTRSIDLSRVYRVPDTFNSKTKNRCKIVYENDKKYRLDELRIGYFPFSDVEKKEYKKITKSNKKIVKSNKKIVKSKVESNILKYFNIRNLNLKRLKDIEKIVQMRAGKVEGKREVILFLYRYYNCLYLKNEIKALEKTLKLNKMFKDPLPESEIIGATASAEKALEKLIDETKGYNYKNSTLINLLEITREEQKELLTIIDKEEKYARNNENRKEKRRRPRNKNGLTEKQQELEDLKVKVLKLKENGMSLRKIAKELKISVGSIQNILSK